MKKKPRRAVSLLLLVLFAAGLLAVPASADEVPEESEFPFWLDDGGLLTSYYGQEVDSLACDHSKEFPVVQAYTEKDASEHYHCEIHSIYCSSCDMHALLSKTPSTEPHIYSPDRQYTGSDHSGPYSSHTHSYQYTCCCCKHTEIVAVPASCTSEQCAGPSDDDPEGDILLATYWNG